MNSLILLLLLVFILPFVSKTIEKQLELFIFIVGIIAVLLSNSLSTELIVHAIKEPIFITFAVLIASIVFYMFQNSLEKIIYQLYSRISLKLFLSFSIIFLGLASSFITAIIASLLLIVIVTNLPIDRKTEVQFVILSCFSIGLGAVLTPIGEPLATIATGKLNESFDFLFKLLGKEVIFFVLFLGFLSFVLLKPNSKNITFTRQTNKEKPISILVRTIKIYVFVVGLTLLGKGFEPLIETYLLNMNYLSLYWLNIISAVLDNATLAAAEISPSMDYQTIKAILMGLMISGGMLIPGNIPNIICSNKLGITAKEWAFFGLPIGILMMTFYFIYLIVTI